MVESASQSYSSTFEMMVREENQKTIYTVFEDFTQLKIIADSEFKIDCNKKSPKFKATHFLQFAGAFNFIEVMDDSKILCIGFPFHVDIYDIGEDPLMPKFIKSYNF